MTTQDVKQLNTRFDGLSSRFDEQSTKFDKKFGTLTSRFDDLSSQMSEFMVFVADQFNKVATKGDLVNFATKDDLVNLATKDDVADLRGELNVLRTEVATKGELAEVKADVRAVKEIVLRLDRRTDEDVRASMKDVAKIKTYLVKRGHHI